VATQRNRSPDYGRAPELSGLLISRLHEVSDLVEERGEVSLLGTSLSLPLNHLLAAVVVEPGVTVTQIARRLGKSQQAISQSADRLERLGFVERRVGPGRAVELHASEAGRAASSDGVQRELQAQEHTREALGPERFSELIELLESARDILLEDAEG
jgi:DNA-binding MarR family transcriptional regulator